MQSPVNSEASVTEERTATPVASPKRVCKRPASASAPEVAVPALSHRCEVQGKKSKKKHDVSLVADKPEDLEDPGLKLQGEIDALKQQKKAMAKAAKAATYEVKKAKQRQKRLHEKAAKMTNSELLTVFLARKERSEAMARKVDAHDSAGSSKEE